jgi:hypothetical protein
LTCHAHLTASWDVLEQVVAVGPTVGAQIAR